MINKQIFLNLKSVYLSNSKRICFYLSLAIVVGAITIFSTIKIHAINNETTNNNTIEREKYETIFNILNDYKALKTNLQEDKKKYKEADFSIIEKELDILRDYLLKNNFEKINFIWGSANLRYSDIIKEENKKGEISGKVTDQGSPLKNVQLKIYKKDEKVSETKTDTGGTYTFRLQEGNYTIKAFLSGYSNFEKEIIIKAKKELEENIQLKKISSPQPTQQTATTISVNDGFYQRRTVSTPRGDFTADILTMNLSQVKVVVDTAYDGDCENNCPVKSLGDFVSQNGGFAGIHGTYFCPTSYSSCTGKTNSFYYKLYNSRIGKKINWDNGLGDYLPFLTIDSGGTAHYYSEWIQGKDASMSAAISCRPALISNGKIVVTEGDLEDKELNYKISHGALGLKGQVFYAVIAHSVNVLDLGYVMKALGVDHAMNIDGGGSSAMYYNGSYKVGPGRSLPNAVVFIKK